jgi:hypothetical protein
MLHRQRQEKSLLHVLLPARLEARGIRMRGNAKDPRFAQVREGFLPHGRHAGIG